MTCARPRLIQRSRRSVEAEARDGEGGHGAGVRGGGPFAQSPSSLFARAPSTIADWKVENVSRTSPSNLQPSHLLRSVAAGPVIAMLALCRPGSPSQRFLVWSSTRHSVSQTSTGTSNERSQPGPVRRAERCPSWHHTVVLVVRALKSDGSADEST